MNRLASILPAAQVLVSVDATSKKRAFEEAGLLFENLHGLSRALITDSLFARERLGSTGLGHGVAIPHGRSPALNVATGAFIRLAEPVDFGASDGQPVDLLFALAVPEHFTQQHLVLLAQLAEMFADEGFRSRLRTATDSDALYRLVADWRPGHSAAA
jgi:PTS system nitrogen regulatory IIA component